ncbi:hypothetical protein VTO42DRAFT_3195 [Malbranchea cinnamomea]
MVQWSRIIPFLIFLVLLAVGIFVGLVVYGIVTEVKARTKEAMEGNNVTFSRDGVVFGVKELRDEDYKDISQSVLVDIWKYGNPFDPRKRRFWRRKFRRNHSRSPNRLNHASEGSSGSEKRGETK